MIEMLGVLAIIGVLSVGGIAGYSKAMMKFKINKTIDQITQISQNVRILYARQRNYGSLNGKIAYKANLAPREMFEDASGSGYSMTNAWGGDVTIYSTGKISGGDGKAFTIQYRGLSDEACIELATQDWGSDTNSGLIAVGIYASGLDYDYVGCEGYANSSYSVRACAGGSNIPVPMPIDVAVDHCNRGNDNMVSFKFY